MSTPATRLPTVEGTPDAGAHVPLIERYRQRLPFAPGDPLVTLQEGSTPLLRAPVLSELVGATVRLKLEGANPTGSFKDRGMTCAVSAAVREGAKAVICASTGNTAASAAAYAARAGITCAVIVPEGKVVEQPETVASAIRIGHPVRWEDAMAAATESRGSIRAVSDEEILAAFRLLASKEGMFCEPASAASVAGLLKYGAEGAEQVVCVLTGRGLKDPETAMAYNDGMVIPRAAEIGPLEEAGLGDP